MQGSETRPSVFATGTLYFRKLTERINTGILYGRTVGHESKTVRQHDREPLIFSLSSPSNGSDATTAEINESFHSLHLASADTEYFRKQRGNISFSD